MPEILFDPPEAPTKPEIQVVGAKQGGQISLKDVARGAVWVIRRVFSTVGKGLQIVVSGVFLFGVLLVAIGIDIRRRWKEGRTLYGDIKDGLNRPSPPRHEHHHALGSSAMLASIAEEQSYSLEVHTVETADGYLLKLHRVSKRAHGRRGAVLLQHGMFQTACAYMLRRGEGKQSMVETLLNAGYDVWLGNNRGNVHSRGHRHFRSSEAKFWDFSIDDLALDVEANVNYILTFTRAKSLVYIGHSQGCAQAFAALSTMPELNEKISLFIALSPAAFVNKFERRAMRTLANIYRMLPSAFYSMFSKAAFIPYMESVRSLVGYRVFQYFGYTMFNHLFGWSHDNWSIETKPAIFAENPAGASARLVSHWLQRSNSGEFQKYCYGKKKNMEVYGSPKAPTYDLSNVKAPVAVIYGIKDTLLNHDRLLSSLETCKESVAIPHHEHMDQIWSADACDTVFPHVLRFIDHYRS